MFSNSKQKVTMEKIFRAHRIREAILLKLINKRLTLKRLRKKKKRYRKLRTAM